MSSPDAGGAKRGREEWLEQQMAGLEARLVASEKRLREAREEADKLCSEAASCKCSVCFDVFKQPVTAPCGHSFCRSCIVAVADDTCACPTCEKELLLPSNCGLEFPTVNCRGMGGAICCSWGVNELLQSSSDAARGCEQLAGDDRSSIFAQRALRWLPWIDQGPMPERLAMMLHSIEAKDVNAADSCYLSLLWWLAKWGIADGYGILAKGADLEALIVRRTYFRGKKPPAPWSNLVAEAAVMDAAGAFA